MICDRRHFLSVFAVLGGAVVGIPTTRAQSGERSFNLDIRGGRVAGGSTIRVRQGDRVRLRWTADTPTRLHLHGYDLETKVAPGAVAEMAFTARAAGRFPIETHGARDHAVLAYLEVHPR